MTNSSEYTPRKSGPGVIRTAVALRPSIARSRGRHTTKNYPSGRHPLQLYSLGTPNGVKITILLEELLAIGQSGAEYDAWLIKIGEGEQFGSGFVSVNPNSKIPALTGRSLARLGKRRRDGALVRIQAEHEWYASLYMIRPLYRRLGAGQSSVILMILHIEETGRPYLGRTSGLGQ